MRELKFRAWDPESKQMLYQNQQYGLPPQHHVNDNAWTRFWESLYRCQEQFVLQQYLGIQDLNGIEVCEGDIIDFGETCYGAIHYKDAEWKYTFYSQGEKASNDLSLSDWIENGVLTKPVVGNIYLHQYLLQ